MLAAYTELKHAQKVKQFLIKKEIINKDYKALKELGYIYFPITKKLKVPHSKVINTRITFESVQRKTDIKDLLKRALTPKQLKLIPRSQEMIGSILILEIPEELKTKEKEIAKAYLESNKQIETVVKKKGMHKGVHRTRTVTILAGKRTKQSIHHENGVRLNIHLEKTYYSARSANERLRIAKQTKPGEEVLVMFSGAAPFPLVIAKNSKPKSIVGIELNPDAHSLAYANVQLNKFQDKIRLYRGDVRTICPKIKKKFDRIAMPLPKTAEEFLDVALKKIKENGIIHLYAFLNEKEFTDYRKTIKKIAKENNHKIRILRMVKCGQFSPGTFRVCFDIKSLN